MIRVAIVGMEGDLFPIIPDYFEAATEDIRYCFQEDSVNLLNSNAGTGLRRAIQEQVQRMLATKPNVLHYANYRVPGKDEVYINYVKEVQPNLPILLTSAHYRSEEVAKSLNIYHLAVPCEPHELEAILRQLTGD